MRWLGNNLFFDDSALSEGRVYHLLDGDDILTAGTGDDEIYGGTGNDTLDGGGGSDTFVYLYNTAGSDTLVNFALGTDVIDLSNLLVAFDESSDVGDYITAAGTWLDTYQLTIDHDLDPLTAQVQIEVQFTSSLTGNVIDALVDMGSLDVM